MTQNINQPNEIHTQQKVSDVGGSALKSICIHCGGVHGCGCGASTNWGHAVKSSNFEFQPNIPNPFNFLGGNNV